MTRRCINYLSRLLLFFACLHSAAQNTLTTPEFFNYLKTNKLFTEESVFIDRALLEADGLPEKDTLQLHKAACMELLEDTAKCNRALEAVSEIPQWNKKEFHTLYLSLLFMKNKQGRIEKYLSSLNADDESAKIGALFLSLKKRQPLALRSEDSLLYAKYPVKRIIDLYKKVPKRSALAAGLFSTLVPGLGKLYAGYKYQAISAFLANALFGAQATEAYMKSGIKSPHFIYAGGLFGVYYLSNIVGSAWAVKKKKRDCLREIDYEISAYYSTFFNAYSN